MPTTNALKQEIYREIAKETGATIKEVEECVEAQFALAEEIMKKGEFESVKIPYMGKFWVKPERLKKLNNKRAIIQRRKL